MSNKAEQLPERIEELLGYILRHVASELRVAECPEPLAESLRVYTRAVIAAERDDHERPTAPTTVISPHATVGVHEHYTLPTTPPVDYNDEPTRRVRSTTSKKFPPPSK